MIRTGEGEGEGEGETSGNGLATGTAGERAGEGTGEAAGLDAGALAGEGRLVLVGGGGGGGVFAGGVGAQAAANKSTAFSRPAVNRIPRHHTQSVFMAQGLLYEVPDGVDLAQIKSVAVYCRAFSVMFSSAELQLVL